jgi:ParB family chromosome partitioning protein
MLSPLIVRACADKPGFFEIIAGERRYRAAVIAGLKEVPVKIVDVSDDVADKLHLAENIHRENLTTLELSARVAEDIKRMESLDAVAAHYKKPKSWLSVMLRIAEGGEVMLDAVKQGVTADRETLATIARTEKKSPALAKELVKEVAKASGSKRAVAQKFVKNLKEDSAAKAKPEKTKGGNGVEDISNATKSVYYPPSCLVSIVEDADKSKEFQAFEKQYGLAALSQKKVHLQASKGFVVVEFGGKHEEVFMAADLRLKIVA